MPPSLAEVQEAFGAALLDPARPAPPGVTGPDGMPDEKRFAVYRNNVVHSLVNALQARFPVTTRLVGEEFFRAMARVFVAVHPPRSPLLMHYGDELPRFIAGFAPARPLPYLADIARLERAWSQSFHAPEATPLTVEALARHHSAQLEVSKLRLHPSLRWMRSNHPVATLWSAHQSVGEVSAPAAWEAEDMLVLRPRAEVLVHLLPASALDFVSELASGATVCDAGDVARRRCPDFDVGQHLLGLVELGAVTAIDTSPELTDAQKVPT
jgi:hypothetical protein